MSSAAPVLALSGIRRRFVQGQTVLDVLQGIDLALPARTITALVGPSGTGKSTLLHIAGLLERPSAGEVAIDGRPCNALNDAERTRLRRERIGFVYQFHHLLADFTALENVAMPLLIAGRGRKEAEERAAALLERLGLAQRLSHRPARLSGGEQQRVAIARALVKEPRLLLADEPTGNLDSASGAAVLALLDDLHRAGMTIVLITHDPEVARHGRRHLSIRNGELTAATGS